MCQTGGQSRNQIEQDEPGGAETILNVVSEYPQIQHVPQQMEDAAVHEHGGQERQGGEILTMSIPYFEKVSEMDWK